MTKQGPQELAPSLSSLCTLFWIRFLWFQSFAGSFQKTPGVGVSTLPLNVSGESRGGNLIYDLTNRPVRFQNRVAVIHAGLMLSSELQRSSARELRRSTTKPW